MNKHISYGMAACLVLGTRHASAQTGAQVYGRLNISVERMTASPGADVRGARVTRLSNNRSVFGFRGKEELGDGMNLVYQVEGALAPDTGGGAIAQRDTRVGLEGRHGTLLFGHWASAYSAATSGLDPFYVTTAAYSSILGNGSAASTDHENDKVSFDRRQANSVHYWTPSWGDAHLRLTHGLSESRQGSPSKPSLTSVAAILDRGAWYVSLAHEIHRNYQGPGLDDTGTKLGVAYRFGNTRVAGVVERLEYETVTGELGRTAWYLSLTHQMGAHGLRASLARANDARGRSTDTLGYVQAGPDSGAVHMTAGYEYALSKRTALHAYLTHLDNEQNAVHDFGINQLGAGTGATLKGATLGMRHAF
ncbi:porin [Massilia niabensis]|uniref:Porin n=1 Tax=Massilia niabensis TaxID=544910 RepID=A0ABW0L5G7_9BURK